MKTEQEQIVAIADVLCDYCKNNTKIGEPCKSSNGTYICTSEICRAEALVQAGYGDVSEYKAEIERLRQEVRDTDKMARNTIEQYRAENKELENALKQSEDNYSRAFERLKAQEREIERLKDKCEELRNEKWNAQDDLDCYCDEMPNKIKRAKIDVLNELKGKMFEREYMGVKYKERIFYESEIDDMIAEVQNGEDKG